MLTVETILALLQKLTDVLISAVWWKMKRNGVSIQVDLKFQFGPVVLVQMTNSIN